MPAFIFYTLINSVFSPIYFIKKLKIYTFITNSST